jgi:hypothetical protein
MMTDNLCFYLQNRLSKTSQTGGQWYSDTSPFSIPCSDGHSNDERLFVKLCLHERSLGNCRGENASNDR